MGIEEEPLPRLNVSDDFAREYVEHGGSPGTVGDVDPDATTPRTSKRTYYRGPTAIVTDDLFIVRDGRPRSVKISGLSKVLLARTERIEPIQIGLVAAVAFLLALAIWPITDSPGLLVGAVGLAVVVVAVSFSFLKKTRRRWELHATYEGADIVLFATSDQREFNQVTRALRRAIESSPHTHRQP